MRYISTGYDTTLELLTDIVYQTPPSATDLVVCSTRDEFIAQLLVQLETRDDAECAPTESDDEFHPPEPAHELLSTSLRLSNASQLVNLVFCPTITALRGYLSSYNPDSASRSSGGQIFVHQLLALHHGTSDFTLQGLSQTFATAVSASHRTNRVLRLVECRGSSESGRSHDPWQAEVQLLSAAIKIGEAGVGMGRRTVSAINIASRWFEVQAHHPPRTTRVERSAPASAVDMLV